jgi:hypothetical protein
MADAASFTSWVTDSASGQFGLTSNPTRIVAAASSCSSCFDPSSAMIKFTPVALPPGRATLAARPSLPHHRRPRNNWDDRGRCLCCQCRRGTNPSDHSHLSTNQIDGQRRQPITKGTISRLGVLRCGISTRPMSLVGQKPNATRVPLCLLPPAADIGRARAPALALELAAPNGSHEEGGTRRDEPE